MSQSSSNSLRRLWRHISLRRRRQFIFLLLLMIIVSFAEIVSIGAAFPFLAILTNPARIFDYPSVVPYIKAMGITDPEHLLLPLTVAFGLASIIAGFMRLILLWASTQLSFATGADLSIDIYRRTLYQPYAVHVARNSSEVITGISTKANGVIYNIILPFITLIGSSVIMVVVLIALLSFDPFVAIAAFGGFGLIYILIIQMTRRRLAINSKVVALESTNVIKSLQEGLGGIRDILIDGSQAAYCQTYRNADHALRSAQASNSFISSSPRYGVEALGMLLIAALAYYQAKYAVGVASAIPTLGVLAIGAQRLLPALQQVYSSWSTIHGSQGSLLDTLSLLDQQLPSDVDLATDEPLIFRQQITLNQLGFRYSLNSPWVLEGLNLKISKGSKVGFIGSTGSGKSTMLDIVMGLLQPTVGTFEVDGRPVLASNQGAWRSHIAHVPQAIFLSDGTIEENIAFGVPRSEINFLRVREAANQAQIAQDIDRWPNKYQTLVGERGIRLSGGQRQRIGIARALYKRADVIIFDEATSALDTETERAVMQAIEHLGNDLTLLIIAHRLTTLKNCTQIVELGGGKIKRVGSYQEMILSNFN